MFTPRAPLWKQLLATVVGILIWEAMKAVLPPRQQAFLRSHLFLVLFLPLAILFLILFCRAYYLQYKD